MHKYYSFVDMPPIPERMIDPLTVIEQQKLISDIRISDYYRSYFVNDELQEWAQQFFDFDAVVRYQVIKKSLPVHIDFGWAANEFKYNYLLTLGGEEVKTMWWDAIDSPNQNTPPARVLDVGGIKPVCSVVLPVNTWHKINIAQPHSTSELTSVRLSVTIKKTKDKNYINHEVIDSISPLR